MNKLKLFYLKNQMFVANGIANFIGVFLVANQEGCQTSRSGIENQGCRNAEGQPEFLKALSSVKTGLLQKKL